MAIKVIPENSILNDGIKLSELQKLNDNYYDRIKKKNLSSRIIDLDRTKDTSSIWFSANSIIDLLTKNGYSDLDKDNFGIRFYMGVHRDGTLSGPINPDYNNQQSIILVVTKKDEKGIDWDQLTGFPPKTTENITSEKELKYVLVSGAGEGMDHGKICPPDKNCNGGNAF